MEVEQGALFDHFRSHAYCKGRNKFKKYTNNFFFCNKSKKRLFLVIFRYFKLSMDLKATRYNNSLNYKIENKVIVVPSFAP